MPVPSVCRVNVAKSDQLFAAAKISGRALISGMSSLIRADAAAPGESFRDRLVARNRIRERFGLRLVRDDLAELMRPVTSAPIPFST